MNDQEKMQAVASFELMNLEQKTKLVNEAKKSGGVITVVRHGLLLLGIPLLIIFFYERYSEIYSSIFLLLILLYGAITAEGYRLDRRIDALIKILDI